MWASAGGGGAAATGRTALWVLAAACAAHLGWSAAPVVWRLAGEDGQIVPAPAAVADAPAAGIDLEPVLAFAPFGRDGPAIVEPQVPEGTDLGLTLLGVTIGNSASASRAIISGGATPVASYPIGARITANADLAEVNPDHVVLRVDGRLERLYFAERPSAPAPAADGNLRNLIPQPPNPAPEQPSPAPETPAEIIARYRAAIQTDAQGVLDRLGVALTEDGYQVGADPSPGVVQAGLRPGDVITTVNGRKVGDLEADRRYFDQVAASGHARLELQRDGQGIVMSFPLR